MARTPESQTITSFDLEPVDPAGWRPFDPGQFLVVRVPSKDGSGSVNRHYSISSSPHDVGRYRITVKRESAPVPDVPHGIGSGYLHDEIAVGDLLHVEGPRGAFVLDRASERSVVLLSGGVGLTPLVSMLHALADSGGRRVFFVHACDSGETHAFEEEVRATSASRPGMTVHTVYRNPTNDDRASRRHQSEGVLSRGLLQELLPLDDYEVYMCGPPAFMAAVFPILRSLGVPSDQIAYEFFGPATLLDSGPARPFKAEPGKSRPAEPVPAPSGITVTFAKSGREVSWDEGSRSLLDFAEGQGLDPPFSCRAGVCSTCITRVVSGGVTYTDDPLDQPEDGFALICCCVPNGSVVLDL